MTDTTALDAATTAPQTTVTNASGRDYSLDALRSFCMLFGFFVHATTLGRYGPIEFIAAPSAHFRMATFFAVSAILGSMVVARKPWRGYVSKRVISLVVPFVVTTILLNPITLWMVWHTRGGAPDTPLLEILRLSVFPEPGVPPNLVWHLHLWFLLVLAAYSFIVWPGRLLFSRAGVNAFVDRSIRAIPASLRVTVIGVLMCGFGLGLRIVGELVWPPLYEIWLLRATLVFLPYFMLGIMIERVPALRDVTRQFDPLSVVLAVALWTGFVLSDGMISDSMTRLGNLVFKYFTNTASIFLLLWVFGRYLSKPHRITSILVRSIYTAYLFHYFLLYAVAYPLRAIGLDGAPMFLAASFVAMAIGVGLHFALIERSSLLTFLFNGKGLARPKRNQTL